MREPGRIPAAALCLLFLAAFCVLAPAASAQLFRIDNRVFVGEDEEPTVETATLFRDAVVYDSLDAGGEITVFHKARHLIILLDPKQEIRASVDMDLIRSYVETLQGQANQEQSSFIRFLANPRFEESFDANAGRLTLSSPFVTYEIETVGADEAVVSAYREFADATAQLSAILYPVAMPPNARLRVNAALARRGLLPTEVRKTVRPDGPGLWNSGSKSRSEHRIQMGVMDADRELVADIGRKLATYRNVTFEEYRNRVHPREDDR